MERLRMSLCTACPEVEIAGDEVRIGEAGHLASRSPSSSARSWPKRR